MHIPDNYLSPSTCAVLGAAHGPGVGNCGKKSQRGGLLRPRCLCSAWGQPFHSF